MDIEYEVAGRLLEVSTRLANLAESLAKLEVSPEETAVVIHVEIQALQEVLNRCQ